MTVARSTNALAVQATIVQSALGCSVRELTRHVLSETLVIVCSGCMNGLDKVKEPIVEYLAVQQRANKLDQQFFGAKDACVAKARGRRKIRDLRWSCGQQPR